MIWPRFDSPLFLLLLLSVPWFVWIGLTIRALPRFRRGVVIALRATALTLLILALAGMQIVQISESLAVFFLVDHSASIPPELREQQEALVRQYSDEHKGPDDQAGMIIFGELASIELGMRPADLEFETVQSYVGSDATNIGGAIRLAMAALPDTAMRRIVVMSDGRETVGDAIAEAERVNASGVELSVVPIHLPGGGDIRLENVTVPTRVDLDEPFQVRVVVHADEDTDAVLRLSRRDRAGRQNLPPQQVKLQAGDNVFLLPQELAGSGFYEYEATITSESDVQHANNQARGFTTVQGNPSVLYVETDPANSTYMQPALTAEGIDVTQVSPGAMPSALGEFQHYDAVLLSNVSATDITADQINGLEAAVRDMGMGLVMVGGPDTFGAGGYHGTAVEEALPVSMDLTQRKVLPRGALVMIMHTCEIPEGNAWARRVGLAALDVLSPQDLMGATGYFYDDNEWIYELQPVGDGQLMKRELMRANPGDMPTMGPTLQRAYDALKDAPAAAKRIIIVSDGDPAAPPVSLVRALANDGISVSTICIAPHSMNDQDMLRTLSEATGGEYYFVNDPNKLPRIFAKEASVVKRGVLVEEEFAPLLGHQSELLLSGAEYPMLDGYVATTPKETATVPLLTHQEDPLLAHWRYGLGKSVAYTSDITTRWAGDWVAWQRFGAFWAQTVRWAMRDVSRSGFQVEATVKDGRGHVSVDAVDGSGNFVNFLDLQGFVTTPAPDYDRLEIDLAQTGPGIYEGAFPLDTAGTYTLNMRYAGASGIQGMATAALALSYPQEFVHNTTSTPFLERLAAAGGGQMLGSEANPFENTAAPAETVIPIWPWLLVIALCLLPIEILLRRVFIDLQPLIAAMAPMLSAIPGMRDAVTRAARPQRATGSVGTRQAVSREYHATDNDIPQDDVTSPTEIGTPDSMQAPSAQDAAPSEGGSEYTRKLLAAKGRALEAKQKKNSDRDNQ